MMRWQLLFVTFVICVVLAHTESPTHTGNNLPGPGVVSAPYLLLVPVTETENCGVEDAAATSFYHFPKHHLRHERDWKMEGYDDDDNADSKDLNHYGGNYDDSDDSDDCGNHHSNDERSGYRKKKKKKHKKCQYTYASGSDESKDNSSDGTNLVARLDGANNGNTITNINIHTANFNLASTAGSSVGGANVAVPGSISWLGSNTNFPGRLWSNTVWPGAAFVSPRQNIRNPVATIVNSTAGSASTISVPSTTNNNTPNTVPVATSSLSAGSTVGNGTTVVGAPLSAIPVDTIVAGAAIGADNTTIDGRASLVNATVATGNNTRLAPSITISNTRSSSLPAGAIGPNITSTTWSKAGVPDRNSTSSNRLGINGN